MSNELFPLAALGAYIDRRSPNWDVTNKFALSGKRFGSTWALESRVTYVVKQESVRSDIRLDYQQLLSFIGRHFGGLDSFLLQDPEDNSASDPSVPGGGMCFGIGNGSQTAFQLQRRALGSVFDNLGGGPWRSSSGPRTNLIFPSSDFTAAQWSKGTGVTAAANATIAPDNTPASAIVYDGTGSAGGMRIQQTAGAPIVGSPSTVSVFLRADAPTTIRLGTNDGAFVTVTLTTTWTRYWFNATLTDRGLTIYSPAGVNTAFRIYPWGAQTEADVAASGVPTKLIPTTGGSGALTQNPQLWPAYADSFLPVYELNGPAAIFRNDWQGNVQLFPWVRTNLCFQSQAFSSATWTKAALSASSAIAAPDGTTTAIPYTPTGNGTASQVIAGLTAGQTYTVSVWVHYASGGDGKISIGTTEGASPNTVLPANTWVRLSFTFVAAGTSTTFTIGIGSTWTTGEVIAPWGAQLEAGPAATSYIATTTAAVAVTDYALALGQVTLAVAPVVAAVLSWLGSYYIRVYLDDTAQKGLDLQRIVAQMWSTGLQLVSVIP